jgi:hypothetical protein
MNLLENIDISLSGNLLLFLFGILILIFYTFYIYRTTLPAINKFAKGILIFLRIIALALLLFLIFDPILKITSTEKVEPKTLVFIDNSKSISEFSSSEEITKAKNLMNKLNNDNTHKIVFFTFGSSLNEIKDLGNETITFNSTSTEFESILYEIKKTDNVASIIILSDGLINEGKDPLNEFNNLGIPVYTIGIGDTATYEDIIIERINANEFIYTENETEIEVIIRNENLAEENINIELYDNDKLLEIKSLQLSNSGINRVKFPYSAITEGEHKLTVKVTSKINEQNKSNNTLSRMINALASKKKITVLAGGPSADLSAVIKSIEKNEDFEIVKIIELSRNNFYKNENDLSLLSESDVIFLVGFPGTNSNPDFIKKVGNIIEKEEKGIFLLTSSITDYSRINDLKIPFKLENISDDFYEVLVKINRSSSSFIGNSEGIINSWNNLPPINVTKTKILPNITSEILITDNSGSIPIIFSNNIGTRKSIVLNGANIWRWIIRSTPDYQPFDNLILNSIKWLSIVGEKQFFNVTVSKRNYRLGEKIIFSANLYDETFEPINNQEIALSLSSVNKKYEYIFSPISDGIYEAEALLDEPGQYNYTAQLVNNPRQLKPVSGSINIEPIELELVKRKLNSKFLEAISVATGGKFSKIDETDYLESEIIKNYENKIRYKLIDKELRLSNLEVILLIIVLLFSFEWIIRKVLRMI